MAKHATIQNERREEARRKLMSYRAKCEIFQKLLVITEETDSRLVSITAQYEETYSSGTAKEKLSAQMAQLEESVDRLGRQCEEMAESLDEVFFYINELVELRPIVATVLSKRYLEPRFEPTFAEIASDMGMDENYVRHKHLEGLDLVAAMMYEE